MSRMPRDTHWPSLKCCVSTCAWGPEITGKKEVQMEIKAKLSSCTEEKKMICWTSLLSSKLCLLTIPSDIDVPIQESSNLGFVVGVEHIVKTKKTFTLLSVAIASLVETFTLTRYHLAIYKGGICLIWGKRGSTTCPAPVSTSSLNPRLFRPMDRKPHNQAKLAHHEQAEPKTAREKFYLRSTRNLRQGTSNQWQFNRCSEFRISWKKLRGRTTQSNLPWTRRRPTLRGRGTMLKTLTRDSEHLCVMW